MSAEKKRMGRPKQVFDLKALRDLMKLHPTNEEVGAFFGCCSKTVERHYSNDEAFREAMDAGRAEGKTSLRRAQTELARAGNPTMLIWLGKQLLGQRDHVDVEVPTIRVNIEDLRSELDRRFDRIADTKQATPVH